MVYVYYSLRVCLDSCLVEHKKAGHALNTENAAIMGKDNNNVRTMTRTIQCKVPKLNRNHVLKLPGGASAALMHLVT